MFSDDLVARTIEYYKNTYDHDISAEIAESYLNSLAEFFESFLNLEKCNGSCKIE